MHYTTLYNHAVKFTTFLHVCILLYITFLIITNLTEIQFYVIWFSKGGRNPPAATQGFENGGEQVVIGRSRETC